MTSSSDKRVNEDINEAIKNTVTSQDVAIVAQKISSDPLIQVINYDLSPYSTDKLGFLGSHRQLKITIKKKTKLDNTIELNLFVKSVPYEYQHQTSLIISEGIFLEEYFYFSEIEPRLLENFKGEKWSADCYLVKKDCLIMENLKLKGYKLSNHFFNNIIQFKSAIASVARFHSTSILVEDQLIKNSQHPTSLNEVYPTAFKEKMFNKQSKFYPWVTSAIDVVRAIAIKFNFKTDKLTKIYDDMNDIIKPSLIHRNVITHGDLWWNNIMFDNSEPLPKCRLVDYQLLRYAPLALDILQLIYVHSSRDFREAHENELIEFYHSILIESVKSSDINTNVPDLEDVKIAYEDLRIYGPALTSLYLSTLLVESEIVNERVKDSEGMKEFIFGDKVEMTLSYMDRNENFRNRMTDVIQELVEIGEKL